MLSLLIFETIITFVKFSLHMNGRIEQFLQAENITKSEFADSLGVSRPSITHILSGRNYPGYEFFKNLSLKYPNLNLGRLITGKGKMYNNQQQTNTPTYEYDQNELFNLEQVSHSSVQTATETLKPAPSNTNKPVEAKSSSYETHNFNNPEQARTDTAINQGTEANQSTKLHQDTKSPLSEKPLPGTFVKERRISKVMVFYDDNTFEELQ